MAAKKGVTLIEIVVVMIILGIIAAITIPNLTSSMEQTNAQAAHNNLLAISAAQEKYFEDYASYCTTTTGNTANCGIWPNLNTNLNLGIAPSDTFTYICSVPLVNPPPFTCTATDGTDTLTLSLVMQGNTVAGNNVSCAGPSCPI